MSTVLRPKYSNISGNGEQLAGEDDIIRDAEKPISIGRVEITADYTVEEKASLVAVGAISAPITITLPSAQNYVGRTIIVQDEQGNGGTHSITIATEGSETINGGTNYVITTNYDRVSIYSNGTNWLA